MTKKLVTFEWIDAQAGCGWTEHDEPETSKCYAAGYLVKETDDYICVAATVSEHECNAFISIPKVWIKNRKDLDAL